MSELQVQNNQPARISKKEKYHAMLLSKEDVFAQYLGTDLAKQHIADCMALLGERELAECDENSLYKVAYKFAQLKLSIVKELQQGYVIPRKNKKLGITEATFQPSYRTWEILAERSGKTIRTMIVYDCDTFTIKGDTKGIKVKYEAKFEEHPTEYDEILDRMRGVLVWVKEANAVEVHFVTRNDLMKRYDFAKKARYGSVSDTWLTWTKEMFLAKAVINVLSKLPLDISKQGNFELAQAIQAENEQYAEAEQTALDIDDIAQPLKVDPENGEVLEIPTADEIEDLKQQLIEQEEQGTLV